MIPTIAEAKPPLDLDELLTRVREFSVQPRDVQKAFIEELVSRHPLVNLEFGSGHQFRRARVIGESEYPAHVDDVIWRKNFPAKVGRANPEGFQVLYLADRQDTALRENKIEQGWAVIASFEIQAKHRVRICPIGEMYRVIRNGRGFLSGKGSRAILDTVNACSLSEARSLTIADAFLYNTFVENDDHSLTSIVSRAIFDKLPMVNAIAYSSRQQSWAINLAVRVDRFWADWCLTSVRRCYARHLAFGMYTLRNVTNVVGVYESGKFLWADHTDDEDARVLLEPYVPIDA